MSPGRGEDALLAEALARFGSGPDRSHVLLDLGHDTAAIDVGSETVVLTNDVLVDGVHFELDGCGAAMAARKALAVNLSDLAAAGATPMGFLVGGVMPRPASEDLFDALMSGFDRAAKEFDCPCVGGDTNVARGPLVLSVTAFGRPGPGGVVGRAGAKPGQVLSVTGPLGGSIFGRHLRFHPRVAEGKVLADEEIASAMMDLSDGLSRDVPRLCAMSGVGAVIDAEAVPIHPDVRDDEHEPLWHALHDGEDFELLLAHDDLDAGALDALADRGVPLHAIGRVTKAPRISLRRASGTEPLPALGYDHFEA